MIARHLVDMRYGGPRMSAFNVVRFRVKPEHEQEFVSAHRTMRPTAKGFLRANLIKTGDHTYCIVAEWRSYANLAAARPELIGMLDTVRGMLEDLGEGIGVTDPVSGESVVSLTAAKIAAKKVPAKTGTSAATKSTKKNKSKDKERKSKRKDKKKDKGKKKKNKDKRKH
jgi:Antibiotic biosynthesis monooxygenase